jgi:hypothetical protein
MTKVAGSCLCGSVRTLHDRSWLTPTAHFWCDTAQPWVEIGDAVSRFAKNPEA